MAPEIVFDAAMYKSIDKIIFIRDLTLGDDALLNIDYVILLWALLIPATKWSCS